MKLFTVIVTFNRPHFLRKCINSIISQTIKPSKIYIVNNNKLKNDNKKIYEEYKNKINIEYLDNYKSIHKVRNDVAFKLNCDYLTFLDDDDQWKPDYISKSLKLIKENKLDAIYTSMDVVDENGLKISELNLKKEYELQELLVYNPGFLTSNLIVNKDVFKNLDGFSYNYGSADKHFFIRILKKKLKYYLNHERLVIRTEHKKQYSKDYKEMFYEKIKFFIKNRKDMNLKTKMLYFLYSIKLLIKFFIKN